MGKRARRAKKKKAPRQRSGLSWAPRIWRFLKTHKTWTSIASACTILGLLVALYPIVYVDSVTVGDLTAHGSDMSNEHAAILQGQDSTSAILERIEQKLDRVREVSLLELVQKYPLGFVLFYAEVDNPFLYLSQNARDAYLIDLDWAETRLDTAALRERNVISFGPVNLTIGSRGCALAGITLVMPARRGQLAIFYGNFCGVDICGEVLRRDGMSYVCVLGLRRGER